MKYTYNVPRAGKFTLTTLLQWHTGDACRARFSEDNVIYEATIIGMNAKEGTCVVRYVGYNNEEEVPLSKLQKSRGESARKQQEDDADFDNSEVRGPGVELYSGNLYFFLKMTIMILSFLCEYCFDILVETKIAKIFCELITANQMLRKKY